MTVACFCGCVYEALYGPPVCPQCGEPVELEEKEAGTSQRVCWG